VVVKMELSKNNKLNKQIVQTKQVIQHQEFYKIILHKIKLI